MGPQGDPGIDGIDGEDGNANVTLYIFEGHDFWSSQERVLDLSSLGITREERENSAWLVYLCYDRLLGADLFFEVPGSGANGEVYAVAPYTVVMPEEPQALRIFRQTDGSGAYSYYYYEIRVIQIEANDVIDTWTMSASSEILIPESLDTGDYEAVAEYYGLD